MTIKEKNDIHSDSQLPMGSTYYGVYPALITDIVDPKKMGRVRVKLMWAHENVEIWARLTTLMAGKDRGTWFVPEVEDEVLVIFEGGNVNRPYVIGSLWNGVDRPPLALDDAGENNIKTIRSRSGVCITLDDTDGEEKIRLETPAGQKVTLKDEPNEIEITDQHQNAITLSTEGIHVSSPKQIRLDTTQLEISSTKIKISAGTSIISGLLKADNIIADSIVSNT